MDLECSHYILSLSNIFKKIVILIKECGNPPLSQENRMESNIPNYFFFLQNNETSHSTCSKKDSEMFCRDRVSA